MTDELWAAVVAPTLSAGALLWQRNLAPLQSIRNQAGRIGARAR